MGACELLRTVKSANSKSCTNEIRIELDSHADNCVVGSNVLIIHDHERLVDVYGYNQKVGNKNARTIDAAVAYDDPNSGQTSIILINQVIQIKDLDSILACPM